MRRAMSIVACVVACGLGLAACGGQDASTVSTPQAVTTAPEAEVARPPAPDVVVRVAGDTVSGGGRKTVTLGATVRIRVVADTRDEVHLHGYDAKADVAPGSPATLTFTADVPGIFELELESRGVKLLDLVVR